MSGPMANGVRFGVAASVWTENIDEGLHLTAALEFGTVWRSRRNRGVHPGETGGVNDNRLAVVDVVVCRCPMSEFVQRWQPSPERVH